MPIKFNDDTFQKSAYKYELLDRYEDTNTSTAIDCSVSWSEDFDIIKINYVVTSYDDGNYLWLLLNNNKTPTYTSKVVGNTDYYSNSGLRLSYMDNYTGSFGEVIIRARYYGNSENICAAGSVGSDTVESFLHGKVDLDASVSSLRFYTTKPAVGKVEVYGLKI